MRSNFSLLTTAAVLALGLTSTASVAEEPKGDSPGAKSDVTIVTNDTGNAPGGTGVEESTESQGAMNKQGLNDAMPPTSGAGSEQGAGGLSTDQGGTGVKGSEQSQGATNKSTQDPGATGMNEGASTGNAPGGTGVEKNAEGQGAQSKSSTY